MRTATFEYNRLSLDELEIADSSFYLSSNNRRSSLNQLSTDTKVMDKLEDEFKEAIASEMINLLREHYGIDVSEKDLYDSDFFVNADLINKKYIDEEYIDEDNEIALDCRFLLEQIPGKDYWYLWDCYFETEDFYSTRMDKKLIVDILNNTDLFENISEYSGPYEAIRDVLEVPLKKAIKRLGITILKEMVYGYCQGDVWYVIQLLENTEQKNIDEDIKAYLKNDIALVTLDDNEDTSDFFFNDEIYREQIRLEELGYEIDFVY